MTARVGAVHLGWDVVSVAGGGGGIPIRPVQVEGTYTPPAYLLADASGRLHTAGADRQRSDLGIAISDVRDILGHKQIRIAGATWPAELVFRARLYNPLASIGKYVRGKPDVIALPYPDDWPDEKIDEYTRLVEQLDVLCEPLPESVALSGYVRALGVVTPPEPGRPATSATGVYSDGRECLVVSVNGDDEQPTESVGVPISPDAMRDAHHADNVVIEVMAAARSIRADTSTVLLTGNVCFNDALRLAFQNHLGHRLRVADHPMHALVLGAAHLLYIDSEYADEGPDQGYGPEPARPGGPAPVQPGPGHAATPPRPPDQGRPVNQGPQGRGPGQPGGPYPGPTTGAQGVVPNTQGSAVVAPEGGGKHGWRGPEPTGHVPDAPAAARSPGRHAAPDDEDDVEQTVRVPRDQVSNVRPDFAAMGGRVTSPPGSPADTRQTTKMGFGDEPAGTRARHPEPPAEQPGQMWNRVKDNLFGAPTIVGAVALAAIAMHSAAGLVGPGVDSSAARSVASAAPSVASVVVAGGSADGLAPGAPRGPHIARAAFVQPGVPRCAIPDAVAPPASGVEPTAARLGVEPAGNDCTRADIGSLHYNVPMLPDDLDFGPPMHV